MAALVPRVVAAAVRGAEREGLEEHRFGVLSGATPQVQTTDGPGLSVTVIHISAVWQPSECRRAEANSCVIKTVLDTSYGYARRAAP